MNLDKIHISEDTQSLYRTKSQIAILCRTW